MEYKIGQAVIYDKPNGTKCLSFLLGGTTGWSFDYEEIETPLYNSRLATEAEILAEIQKHGWKRTNSWRCISPSGQLELMDNDGWQPIIYRQPLPDQFEFFGNECIQAARISKALNLANEKPD